MEDSSVILVILTLIVMILIAFNHPGYPDIDLHDPDSLLLLRNLIALVSGCSLGELTSMEKLVSELFASKDITKVQSYILQSYTHPTVPPGRGDSAVGVLHPGPA